MTQHTPGPWGIAMAEHTLDDTLSHIHVHQLVDGSAAGPLVAMAARFGAADGWTNARLIAAAPELLEALGDAEFLMRKVAINPKEAHAMADSLHRSAQAARTTIAKATGG